MIRRRYAVLFVPGIAALHIGAVAVVVTGNVRLMGLIWSVGLVPLVVWSLANLYDLYTSGDHRALFDTLGYERIHVSDMLGDHHHTVDCADDCPELDSFRKSTLKG